MDVIWTDDMTIADITVSDLFGSGLTRIRIPAESVEGIARVEAERVARDVD